MESGMPAGANAFVALATFAVFALFILLMIVLSLLIRCKVFAKAGYGWALGLLMMVPIANFVMLLYLAFADWPVLQELRQLRGPGSRLPA